MTTTEQATDLSVECTLAWQPGYEMVHGQCRQTEDVPLPFGRGILLVGRCRCTCHHGDGARVKTVTGLALYVAAVTGPVLALVLARTPH
ncbi:hypothetical protein [Streptomyces sp. NBC_00557]|uniref:hypothetical protein n=1 Tax=Streptomyces sp. NBC_00557 TaxID=2975776 RepID=UPI002E81D6EE|nr:hypothetical protein [Streptomyces sp. NBC_00557]WUC33723.1 hypothetical protein OG956_05615 [Streptomyces sp. NBC_00557]